MRFLGPLLLAIGIAGACPALAEVTILRGSSAPPELPAPPPPPPPPVVPTQREIVYVPVYNAPAYYVTFPTPVVRHQPLAPVTPGVTSGAASGWPLFGPTSPRR